MGWMVISSHIPTCWNVRTDPSALIKLAAGDSDADFYTAKITTTRFFAEHIAPRTLAYGYEVVNGADSTLELADELF